MPAAMEIAVTIPMPVPNLAILSLPRGLCRFT
jgi:hypothetical protein